MAEYPKRLEEMLEGFELLTDRHERINVLIGMADKFQPPPETVAKKPYPEETKVPACESEAFAFAVPRDDGTLKYHFAVENPQGISAMAMAVILDETLSGEPPENVLQVQPDVIYQIFGNELSMGKSMGLMGMVQLVQKETKDYLATRAGNGQM